MLLGKFVVEENRLKRLIKTLNRSIIDFDKRVKEAEEVIQTVQY